MRGAAGQVKCHYKGNNDDYIVIVESAKAVNDWKNDKTIPLAQVVNGFKVFVTHRHGNQGVLDTASKGSMEEEFGTSKEDDVIEQILMKGTVQETEAAGHSKEGAVKASGGAMHAH